MLNKFGRKFTTNNNHLTSIQEIGRNNDILERFGADYYHYKNINLLKCRLIAIFNIEFVNIFKNLL